MRDIIQSPYDNELRMRWASEVESSDPGWAEYIRDTLILNERSRRDGVDRTRTLLSYPERWAKNLIPYVHSTRAMTFVRGLPMEVGLQPSMFLEYAQAIFRAAPVRHVRFVNPYDEDGALLESGKPIKFPLAELLASPDLAHLDSIEFQDCVLPDDFGEQLAACPHLTRCLYLNFWHQRVTERDLRALAAGPLTGKMLGMRSETRDEIALHTYQVEAPERYGMDTYYRWSPVARELEDKHGYIPWLHQENAPSVYDLRWHFENGRVPKVLAGTKPTRDEWYVTPPPRLHVNQDRWC